MTFDQILGDIKKQKFSPTSEPAEAVIQEESNLPPPQNDESADGTSQRK